ncbi:MAG: 50S ribosomal protein L23 [Kiritimatiellae bacterium]|nr:50S ribosomal protein L23 [Kiritimatiellia bacterium]
MKESGMIVIKMQLTEKGSILAEKENKYLFQVAPSANKIEIRRAIEDLYSVTVVKVNTMNYLGKKKRERTIKFGKRSDWKRAVVTLKEGDSIDLT